MLKVEGKELIHYKGKIVIPETLKTASDVLVSYLSSTPRINENAENNPGNNVLAKNEVRH